MSLNPLNEVKYRYRLAMEHLERAERLFSLKDWVGVVSASQLAIENFAKAIIAIFEIPTWSHDPSNRLNDLVEKFPDDVINNVKELAILAREIAPEHGRSTYGEPITGLMPSDIYKESHALNALEECRKAKKIAEKVLEQLNVRFK